MNGTRRCSNTWGSESESDSWACAEVAKTAIAMQARAPGGVRGAGLG